MTWFKIDDKSAFHKKIVGAGNEAWGALCRAGAWSAEHLTDGKIPWSIGKTIAGPRVWRRLFDVKLCERIDDESFQIHNYLDWNPSRAEVLKVRQLRATSGRAGGRRTQQTLKQTLDQSDSKQEANADANGQAKIKPVPVPVPVEREENARAGEAGYDLAWRVWSDLWRGKYRTTYQRTIDQGPKGDDRMLQQIGALALACAEPEPALRHKLARFFDDRSPWLMEHRHPIRAFAADWNKYGEPATAPATPSPRVEDAPMTAEQCAAARKLLDEQNAQRAADREKRQKISADLETKLRGVK